jgi:aspartate/methionine/tyrosine aminotransferase
MPALKLRAKSENLLGSLIREVSKDSMDQKGLIPLWFGEGHRSAPEAVVAEAHKAIDGGYQFYASSAGRPELREAIAASIVAIKASPVRAADALHVAAAKVWGADLFVSADDRQLTAARKAGLTAKAV